MTIPEKEIVRTLESRHGSRIQQYLRQATVGIMGLGGLGSNLAASLTRIGVGKMLMADYDIVELSNINRQFYFLSQIGEHKTTALENNLAAINPYLEREYIKEKLTENNIPQHFPGVDILVECFDQPDMKASALRAVLTALQGIPFVCASGLAGYGPSNEIITREIHPDVFMVGDHRSAAGSGFGLMAPRVAIAANHQANQVVRLIIERGSE
ncbi:MAG: sulfur carrier protein ThiS adenylyltransferase ThiF [Desulfurivibrionaceae bacterium]